MTVNDIRNKTGPFSQALAEWTSRELQLTRLHEELYDMSIFSPLFLD